MTRNARWGWLFVSPWVLGFGGNAAARVGCVGLGVALAAIAAGALLKPRPWEHWLAAVAGLVIASAPWLLGFAAEGAAARNAEAVGLVSTMLALWAGLHDSGGFGTPGSDRMAL